MSFDLEKFKQIAARNEHGTMRNPGQFERYCANHADEIIERLERLQKAIDFQKEINILVGNIKTAGFKTTMAPEFKKEK